jgi:hypothetical protein
MSLNQRVTAEFSTCTPSAPHARDLSIQTYRSYELATILPCSTGPLVPGSCSDAGVVLVVLFLRSAEYLLVFPGGEA